MKTQKLNFRAILFIVFLLIAIFSFAMGGNAQQVRQTRDGNYEAVKATRDSATTTNTGKTYTDSKGQTFPVFISKNGKLFINRISHNTLKTYRQYLKID